MRFRLLLVVLLLLLLAPLLVIHNSAGAAQEQTVPPDTRSHDAAMGLAVTDAPGASGAGSVHDWASQVALSDVGRGGTAAVRSEQRLPPSLRAKFEPSLLKKMLAATDDQTLRGIVLMRAQPDTSQLDLAGKDRPSRGEAVVRYLQSQADRSQTAIRQDLERARLEEKVTAYDPLWIVNGIAVQGNAQAFSELAAHPDVAFIREDHLQYLPDDEFVALSATQHESDATSSVQWNIQRVRADLVWQTLGITGQGAVVASLDSGVDWEHPALTSQYRGYTGKPFADHLGNWYCATDEDYAYPGDGLGHGTHTMGTVVAQDGIGAAPGAKWIAAKVFDNQGRAYDSWIHDGFQWVLAPNGDPALAPDIVNNSWGSQIGASETFLPDVQALRAAGILPVFSAGNYGPSSETVGAPGSFPESLAVGATDAQDGVARFSSRGPSPWDEVKPDVSAPGVGIVSAAPGGGLAIQNGTSMAAPHVTGLAALMHQANPALTVKQMEEILAQTAHPQGQEHPNNDYGWGIVDAYAAVTQAASLGRVSGLVTDARTGIAVPGARVRAAAHGSSGTIEAQTDASGMYEIALSAGFYDVTVSAFGYRAEVEHGVEVSVAMTTTLDVPLTALPTGTLAGTVRETGTNLPLRARVYVPQTEAMTESAASSGLYSLVLPEGTHTVRVECDAHRIMTMSLTISGDTTTYRDFSLDPAPTILLVDSGAWYNASQRSFYETALKSLNYLYDQHIIANVDVSPTDVPTAGTLLPYDLVIWSAPQDSPGLVGATAAVTTYLNRGGRLVLSGQDIAFWDGGGSAMLYEPYLEDYLKVWFLRDDAASRVLTGQGPLFAGLTITITGGRGADNQYYPDVVASADPDHASPAWTYQGDGAGGLVVGHCLPYRTVYLSFGLEAVNDTADRARVLAQSIDWLVSPPQPAGSEWTAGTMPQIARPGEELAHILRLRNTGETETDTFSLELDGGTWPGTLQGPSSIALAPCQSTWLTVSVTIPSDVGWHVYDTHALVARSALSPSLVITAPLLSKTPAPVLLVNGSRFFQVQDRYQDALETSGILYDYHRVKRVWPPAFPEPEVLARYPVVVWYTAYDWFRPLDVVEQARLVDYLDGGGRLFLSSQDYLYYSHDSLLARSYLGVLDHGEDKAVTHVWGEPGHPIGWESGPYTLTYTYTNWSDTLVPTTGTRVAFREQNDYPAWLTRVGDRWRTSFAAFPFDALEAGPASAAMGRTVGWLSWLGQSSWTADRRTVAHGGELTMTCALRNDGWADVGSAYLAIPIPAALSLVSPPTLDGASYHPVTRTVTWRGELSQGQTITASFLVRLAEALPDGAYIPFPATIGYDDHHISFERPLVLRVNAPDLSSSSMSVVPALSAPHQTLTYTLSVRNTGLDSATAIVTATLPAHSTFTGTLHSGGVGSGEVLSDVLSWTGTIAAGGEATLRYSLDLDGSGDHWLIHTAWIADQYGERWPFEARTWVQNWRTLFPLMHRGFAHPVPTPTPFPLPEPGPTPTRAPPIDAAKPHSE